MPEDPLLALPARRPLREWLVRWAPYSPVLALVVVASIQITLALSTSLTPWKGGGFGMFSTADSPSNRPVRIVAVGRERERPIKVPADLLPEIKKVQAWPSRWRMARLARRVAERLSRRTRGVRALRIEVLHYEFDGRSSTLRYVPWRSLELPVPSNRSGGNRRAPNLDDPAPRGGDDGHR